MIDLNYFKGWPVKEVLLPNRERIICLFCKTGNEPDLDLYDTNHNVYRLDQYNHILWQVQRDDSNMPDDWWETMHAIERKHGREGERAPFRYMWLTDRDDNVLFRKEDSGMPPEFQEWVDGAEIKLTGSLGRVYVLDIETGIAKNITDGPVSVWDT